MEERRFSEPFFMFFSIIYESDMKPVAPKETGKAGD